VTLQGLGEPLLAPDLLEMVAYAKKRGVRVGFNTNGTLLTRAVGERLVDLRLDWLHVSLDGARAATFEGIRDGASFERVRTNVRGLLEIRRACGSTHPRVLLVFVAMRRNVGELPEIVRLAADLGTDGVHVQNLSHTFSDTDPAGAYDQIRRFAADEALWDDTALDELFSETKRLASELDVELRLPRLVERPTRPPGEPGCGWPWHSAYVDHRGAVQPCCMIMGSDRATLGEVGPDGLRSVWRGHAYRRFRERLLSRDDPPEVCRGCSLYRGLF
jgi:radical SAM protein with 4Fe4S-binding SPASM domain